MAIPIRFRSISNKSNRVIAIALWIAFSAHAFAWFYWHPITKITAPELPDWINIKLVAGFEEQKTVTKPKAEPVTTSEPQPAPRKNIKEKRAEEKLASESEASQKLEIIEKEAAPASTFVQADSRPYALDNPKPVYPSVARRRGMQGLVLLQVRVSEEGKVTGIHVVRSSGFRILDVVAVDSVKQWRFMPARENDMTVTSTVQVPVRFSLNN
jgi:protein TonB